MANDKPMIGLSAEQFQEMLSTILAKANQMNPLEAKKYQEDIEKSQRLEIFKATLAAEVAAEKARKLGCSHRRHPNGTPHAGLPAPEGQGEWATGGQTHGRSLIGLACIRCGKGWLWVGSPGELDFAEANGLLTYPPPSEDRCLTACRHCSQFFTNKELRAHEDHCPKKLVLRQTEALMERAEHA